VSVTVGANVTAEYGVPSVGVVDIVEGQVMTGDVVSFSNIEKVHVEVSPAKSVAEQVTRLGDDAGVIENVEPDMGEHTGPMAIPSVADALCPE
jgi:hypothetical protein